MKKYYPRTLEDAIESDRCHIEIMLGRKLAPFEELNFQYLSNRVQEFFDRHKGQPLLVMDYERDKFQYFMDKVHAALAKEGL